MSRVKRGFPGSHGELISLGGIGWVHKVDDHIALKSPREQDCEQFAFECKMYDIFGQHRPCRDLCQSFLRVPGANFLALYSGGSLHERLDKHQIRDDGPCGGRLIEVRAREPLDLVERWIMELSSAAAWLESLGYVHTDIRPPNLLLDGQDHLKLSDFDCVQPIGTAADGGAAPWARVFGLEAGAACGSFGINGARYEQFAIGSVLYMMTRGYEPYDDGSIDPKDGPVVVDLFQQMKFPPLGDEMLDTVIARCWNGYYNTLRDLADETKLLPGARSSPRAAPLEEDYCERMRRKCEELVEQGYLLDG